MSFAERPRLDLRRSGRLGDDLDGLLRDFFRAQLPEPWPALKPPAALPLRLLPPAAPRWSRWRSRFALAASVGLLMVGHWFLSNRLPTASPVRPDVKGGGEAGRGHLEKLLTPKKTKVLETIDVGPDGNAVLRLQELPGVERPK